MSGFFSNTQTKKRACLLNYTGLLFCSLYLHDNGKFSIDYFKYKNRTCIIERCDMLCCDSSMRNLQLSFYICIVQISSLPNQLYLNETAKVSTRAQENVFIQAKNRIWYISIFSQKSILWCILAQPTSPEGNHPGKK